MPEVPKGHIALMVCLEDLQNLVLQVLKYIIEFYNSDRI